MNNSVARQCAQDLRNNDKKIRALLSGNDNNLSVIPLHGVGAL
jgi:hypothetical protein